jgi:SH3 domain-containing YSC84-like protein 1
LPAWGGDKAKDEKILKKAGAVLQAMLSSKAVPSSLLETANCIIVLPGVKKFAVGFGGSGGHGPMSCRKSKNFAGGKWSPPAMYTISGASAGLQFGGSSPDFGLSDGKLQITLCRERSNTVPNSLQLRTALPGWAGV